MTNYLVNTLDEVLRGLQAKDVSSNGRRGNRHIFDMRSSPRTGATWDYACSAFQDFIYYSDFWLSEFKNFISTVSDDVDVEFYCHDSRNFFFAIHQFLANPKADLTYFSIKVRRNNLLVREFVGNWTWDGTLIKKPAAEKIVEAFGSVGWAVQSLFSAVDNKRYESAHFSHGFFPCVVDFDYISNSGSVIYPPNTKKEANWKIGLKEFIESHSNYCQEIERIFDGIPTEPRQGLVFIEIKN